LDLHNTRKKVSKSGLFRAYMRALFTSYKKIAMPVYEIRWPRFVKNTEGYTASDTLKHRNEIRRTSATHSPGLHHFAILNISEKTHRAGKEYYVA